MVYHDGRDDEDNIMMIVLVVIWFKSSVEHHCIISERFGVSSCVGEYKYIYAE